MTTIEKLAVVMPASWVPGPKQGQWNYKDYASLISFPTAITATPPLSRSLHISGGSFYSQNAGPFLAKLRPCGFHIISSPPLAPFYACRKSRRSRSVS